MCKHINMKKNKELVKGVQQMMTLSQSVFCRGVAEGVEKGIAKGKAQGITSSCDAGEDAAGLYQCAANPFG